MLCKAQFCADTARLRIRICCNSILVASSAAICYADLISDRKCASFASIMLTFLLIVGKGLLIRMPTQDLLNGYPVPLTHGFKHLLERLQGGPIFSKPNRGPMHGQNKFCSSIFLSSLVHGVEIRLRMIVVAVGLLTTEPSHRQGQSLKSNPCRNTTPRRAPSSQKP
jgi:hypothetical protein